MNRPVVRILIITLFSVLFAASTALAGFALKSGVYRMSQLDAAKSEALASKKAMAFLYSDEKTFCSSCGGASTLAMEMLSGSCVVVYVDKSEGTQLPKQAQTALRSPQAGKYIPSIVVMSYDLKNVIAIIPYASSGEAYKKLLAEAKRKILSYGK